MKRLLRCYILILLFYQVLERSLADLKEMAFDEKTPFPGNKLQEIATKI